MDKFNSLFVSLNIVKYRQKANLTQQKLADIIGISKNTLSQYERNVKTPSIIALEKIAKGLNITVDHLISENLNDKNKILKLRTYLEKTSKEDKQKINTVLNFIIENYYN